MSVEMNSLPAGSPAPPILASLSFAHPRVDATGRDAIAIAEADLADRLRALDADPAELVVISTCLRHELIAVGIDAAGLADVARRLSRVAELPDGGEFRYGREAVHHLFSVTAGLKSPVVGEPEVLGQVRRAQQAARDAGTIGPVLDQLFREAIRTARDTQDVLPDVDHGSIAAIAADILGDRHADGTQPALALVGAGAMAAAVLDRLDADDWTLTRLTRRPERLGGDLLGLDHLVDVLAASDLAVTAVTSSKPLLDADALRDVAARRAASGRGPLAIIDLGMPANVTTEPVDGIEHLRVDDLAGDNRHRRATDEAEALIEVRAYEVHARILNSSLSPLIRALREKAEAATAEELARAFGRLGDVDDREKAVITQMARTLANRLLHDPLSYLSSHPEAISASQTARDMLGIDA